MGGGGGVGWGGCQGGAVVWGGWRVCGGDQGMPHERTKGERLGESAEARGGWAGRRRGGVWPVRDKRWFWGAWVGVDGGKGCWGG